MLRFSSFLAAAGLAAVSAQAQTTQPPAPGAQPPASTAQPPAAATQPPAPAAQTAAPAAQRPAQAAQPSAEETAELRRVVNRGRQLFEIDRAARLTTRELLTRIPDPAAAGVVGWFAQPEGNGLTVTYYAQADNGPVAVFRGQVIEGRVAARDAFTAANRPALTPFQRRLVAARAAVEALGNQACGAAPFNIFAIPPATPTGAIDVYQFSAQTAAGQIPAGGHFLTTVASDGSAGTPRALSGACRNLEVPQPAQGQRPRPLQLRHDADPLPNEAHVLMSYWAGRPVFVAAGTPERLWGIAGDEIRLVGRRRDAAAPAPSQVPRRGQGR
jgi:hypothetical protein